MPNVESYDDLVLHIAFARLKGNNFSLGTQILDKVGDERRFSECPRPNSKRQ